MKTREKVARFIEYQMDPKRDYDTSSEKHCVHYGLCELRDLMDFIYEGEPTEEEEIKNPNRP